MRGLPAPMIQRQPCQTVRSKSLQNLEFLGMFLLAVKRDLTANVLTRSETGFGNKDPFHQLGVCLHHLVRSGLP